MRSPVAWETIERIAATVLSSLVWTWGVQVATNVKTTAVNAHYVLIFMIGFVMVWQILLVMLWRFRGKEFSFYDTLISTVQQIAGYIVIVEAFFPARSILRVIETNDAHAIFLLAVIIASSIGIIESLARAAVERVVQKIKSMLTGSRGGQATVDDETIIIERIPKPKKTFIQRMFNGEPGRFSSNANVLFIFIFLFREYEPFKNLSEHYFGTNPYSTVLPFILAVVLSSILVTALLVYLNDKFPSVVQVKPTSPAIHNTHNTKTTPSL